jgi:hypothetical protein
MRRLWPTRGCYVTGGGGEYTNVIYTTAMAAAIETLTDYSFLSDLTPPKGHSKNSGSLKKH